MTKNQTILLTIKSTALDLFSECDVVLFGSRARMDNSDDSDYDILVILPKSVEVKQKLEYKSQFRKALIKQNIIADVLIESKDEVKIKQNLLGHIIREALKEGVTI